MSRNEIRHQLRDYLVANMLFDVGELDDDTPLLSTGILDSMGVLEMVLFIEETFHVEVSDAEVLPAYFESVNTLSSFVANKLPVQRLHSAS